MSLPSEMATASGLNHWSYLYLPNAIGGARSAPLRRVPRGISPCVMVRTACASRRRDPRPSQRSAWAPAVARPSYDPESLYKLMESVRRVRHSAFLTTRLTRHTTPRTEDSSVLGLLTRLRVLRIPADWARHYRTRMIPDDPAKWPNTDDSSWFAWYVVDCDWVPRECLFSGPTQTQK